MATKQRLELTWIGKYEQPNLEPRILIEDPSKSYGDKRSENMLIHGDNLLALKALEQDFTNKIKCIYIDPPYNTGSRIDADGEEVGYEDGLEHSEWLQMMRPRIELIYKLLSKDGLLWISIDDLECHYLKVLCDEVFGRNNFVTTIAVKMSTASGVKTSHREKTIIKEKEYVLVYSKDKNLVRFNPQYIPQVEWNDEFQYILIKNGSSRAEDWQVKRLNDVLNEKGISTDPKADDFRKFVIDNAGIIWRRAFIRNTYKELSQNNPDKIFYIVDRDMKNEHYYYRGREMYFYKDSFHNCFTEEGYKDSPSHLVGDFWVDINTGKLFNEGGIDFRNGKKPEFLIARIFELSTQKGDWVLDSFLGSGTTSAVSHKMGRKWIGIELGEHCDTHTLPRLKAVVEGADQGGVSVSQDWKGGGGFKYYELGPSLLRKDNFGNWVIEEEYKPDMLASAMAKHEGFKYCPDQQVYWKHGQSTERDFIYTTTNFLTVEMLDQIHGDMKHSESLLICCKSFSKACDGKYANITVKKIPNMLLGRCEFGKNDYSLNIVSMPVDEEEEDFVPTGPDESKVRPKSKKVESKADLFSAKKGKK